MSYFVKKSWIALTMIAAALSVASVCDKRPADKSKPKQIVLDRLVNELVCEAPNIGSSSRPSRLGIGIADQDFFAALGDKYYCKIKRFER